MALLRQFYTNFIAGEITPLLSSRVDTDAYKNGVKTLENFRILSQGGVKRRGGFSFIRDLNATYPYQMESFVFDEDEAYIALFSSGTNTNSGLLQFINVTSTPTVTTILNQAWNQSQIGQIKVAQSLDTMIIVHPDIPTKKVLRTGENTFTISDFAFDTSDTGAVFQPYHRFSNPAITLTPQNTGTSSQTLTASTVFFQSSHAGEVIEYTDTGGNIRYFTIASVQSNTTATGSFNVGPVNTNAVTTWKEQVFSETQGFARSVIFHDQRLIFGGSRALPNFLFMSKVGEFFNFDVGTGLDNESIQVQIAENQVSTIKSLNSFRHLSIFTSEKELFVPTVDDRPLTPSTISIKTQTSFGSSEVPPVEFDGAIVFLTKTRGAIREFIYSDINQAYNSDALTLLSSHMIGATIDMAAQREATDQVESYLYTVNSAGEMCVFMSLRKERIQGWSKFTTNGTFEQVVVVNRDVFAIVKRSIGGLNLQSVEKLSNFRNVDFHKLLTSPVTVTADVITWERPELKNTQIEVFYNGVYYGSFLSDTNGHFDIPTSILPYNNFVDIDTGISYTANLETLPPEFQLQDGISFGQKRRVVRAVLDLNETANVKAQGTKVQIRNVSDDFSQPATNITAQRELYFLGWGNQGTITVTQDEPQPITINGILTEVEV